MGQHFAANPTTPVIWEHLISLLEQVINIDRSYEQLLLQAYGVRVLYSSAEYCLSTMFAN